MLVLTALENIASAVVQVSIFFYTQQRLGFTGNENLALALIHGAAYTAGALLSHRLTARIPERPALLGVLALQLGLILTIAASPTAPTVWVCSTALLIVYGLKWPIIESCVVAGRTPRQAAKALGAFNITWSTGVAIAVAGSGSLIALGPRALFAASATATIVAITLGIAALPRRLQHLDHDHPERPDPNTAARLADLLASARWSMFGSYMLLQVVNPLLPDILEGLGVSVALATVLATVMFATRSLTFAALQLHTGWHGRAGLLAVTALALPAGALIILTVPSVPAVIIGQMIFGAAMGTSYYAALYYAMVLKNAAVDAGGAHEAVIGLGFLAGPIAGLASRSLAAALASPLLGYTLALLPALAPFTALALFKLRRRSE